MNFVISTFLKRAITGTLLVSVLVFVFVTNLALAQFNPEINYQGKLTNASGVAVADGLYNMNFWLVPTSGGATSTAVWSEARTGGNQVQVTNGLFSVMLGEVSSLASVDFHQTLYLAVEVGGTGTPAWDGEMLPRKVLGAVPAAFVAQTAATADNATLVGGVASSSFLRSDEADTMTASSSSSLLTLVQNGVGKILSLFSGVTEVFTILANGNVGVGTSTPTTAFSVSGNSTLLGNATSTGAFYVGGNVGIGTPVTFYRLSLGGNQFFSYDGAHVYFSNPNTFIGENSNTNKLELRGGGGSGSQTVFIDSAGSIGLGDAAPDFKLEVVGTSTSGYFGVSSNSSLTGDVFTVNGSGNVGIGISSPSSKLSMGSSTANQKLLLYESGNFRFGFGTPGAGELRMFTAGSGSFIGFGQVSSSDGSTYTEYGRFAAGGNFGIGTSTPSQMLTVGATTSSQFLVSSLGVISDGTWNADTVGAVYGGTGLSTITQNQLLIGGAGNTWSQIATSSLGLSAAFSTSAQLAALLSDETGTGAAVFGTSPTIASPTVTGTLAGAAANFIGNVGIGTTTPSTSLSVVGDVALTGDLRTDTQSDTLTFIGVGAGQANTVTGVSSQGKFQTAVGYQSLFSNTTGFGNSALGHQALYTNTTGSSNNAFGDSALKVSNGHNNNAFGRSALLDNTTGSSNTVMGDQAMLQNTTGSWNVAIGSGSLSSNKAGQQNTIIGAIAGSVINTATSTGANTIIGYGTGGGIVTGVNNTILGANVTGLSSTLSNNIIIADGAGNRRINVDSNGNVGIGTTTPGSKLTVAGDAYLTGAFRDSTNASGTAGMVLQTTGTGTQWVATSTLGFTSGATTFLGLTDTISSFTANRILYTSGSAVVDNADFTYDGTNLGLGGDDGIAFGGNRVISASTTANNYTFGENAGSPSMTGGNNVLIGNRAGDFLTSGGENIYIGTQAGRNNNTGSYNVAIGWSSLNNNNASDNTAVGYASGDASLGSANSFFGHQAATNLVSGDNNNYFGYFSGRYLATSSNSTLIGRSAAAGTALYQANNLTVLGNYAGNNLATGANNNILIGYAAADNLTTGANNLVIGYDVNIASTTGSNQLNIGNLIFGTGVDGTGTTLSSGNVGIGTTTPSSKLTVAGDIFATGAFRDSTNASGTLGMILQTTGTSTRWVATSTLGIGGGASTFLSLTDTPSSYIANRIMFTNSGATALTDSANLTYDGTDLGLGGTNGIAFGGTRYISASTTNDSITFGELAGLTMRAGQIYNVAIGYSAGQYASTTNSDYNVFLGFDAGKANTGTTNNIIGSTAGHHNLGSWNNLIGYDAGGLNSGDDNNIIGYQAGHENAGYDSNIMGTFAGFSADGSFNNILGYRAGYNNTLNAGYSNIFGYDAGYENDGNEVNIFGRAAGYDNTGDGVVLIGSSAGNANTGNYTIAIGDSAALNKAAGADSIMIGRRAGYALSGADNVVLGQNAVGATSVAFNSANNVAIGARSGYNMAAGSNNNILLGYQAGENITTGDNNIVIGYDINLPSAAGSNQLNIGNIIFGTGIDGTNGTLSSGNIGIGTTTPGSKLTVAGDIFATGAFRDSSNASGTLGMVLQSTGTSTRWVATSTLGISSGASTFLGLTDTISSFTANRILYTSGSAVVDSADFTYDGTNLGLGGDDGLAIGGVRILTASTTISNYHLGENSGNGSITGTSNITIGTGSGLNLSSGNSNTLIGSNAGLRLESGSTNVAIGALSLFNNVSGIENVAVGDISGINSLGSENSFLGVYSGSSLVNGDGNLFAGYQAGYNVATTSGSVMVGPFAGAGSAGYEAYRVTLLGGGAGYNMQSGSDNNILIGYNAADNLTTGANNLVIGYDVDIASTTGSNQLNIGNIIFGNGIDGTGTTLSSGNIGIGTTTPGSKLTVDGDVAVINNVNLQSNSVINVAGNRYIHGYTLDNTYGVNQFMGYQSGNFTLGSSTSQFFGIDNLGIGSFTLSSLTEGTSNTAVGQNSMSSLTGAYGNTALGSYSLWLNTTGDNNTALGVQAMMDNVSGFRNTAIGASALTNNESGENNIGIGYRSMFSNATGSQNVALGSEALAANLGSWNNTAIGFYALNLATSENNTAVGSYAGQDITTGDRNTILGNYTGLGITTGSYNTIIGSNVTGLSSALSNNIIIADGEGNRRINVDSNGNVGIGTTSPIARLSLGDGTGSQYLAINGASNQNKGWRILSAGGTQESAFISINSNSYLDRVGDLYIRDGGASTVHMAVYGTGTVKAQVYGDIRTGTASTNGCVQRFDGTAIAGTCSSDADLKTEITPFTNSTTSREYIEGLSSLTPVRYKWNEVAAELYKNGTSTVAVGLIAQDIELVFPELVTYDGNGYRQVDFAALPFYIMQAVKEFYAEFLEVRDTVLAFADSFRSQRVETDALQINTELCVDGVCVTAEQLKVLLLEAGGVDGGLGQTVGVGELLSESGNDTEETNIETESGGSSGETGSTLIESDEVSSLEKEEVGGDVGSGDGGVPPGDGSVEGGGDTPLDDGGGDDSGGSGFGDGDTPPGDVGVGSGGDGGEEP